MNLGDCDVVKLSGITKSFRGVRANDGVDLYLRRGQIHALLGENGAGKTTLMNILSGLYRPDAGTISVWGESLTFKSPRDALARGIGMVHQHFELVNTLTVWENIVLGHRPSGFFYRPARLAALVAKSSAAYGIGVDPDALVWQLSVGEQQRVEILRLLHRGAELMILDEPTAVLTPAEAEDLYRSLRLMADSGKAIVFITHRLNEVMTVADVITVLRGGRVVGNLARSEASVEKLTRMMIGRDVTTQTRADQTTLGEPRLVLESVSAKGDRGITSLTNVSLTVRAGEILGVAGVAGNGQRELAEVITGLRRCVSGRILVDTADITNYSPERVVLAGVRYVPEERMGVGLVSQCTVAENAVLRDFGRAPYSRGFWLERRVATETAIGLISRYDIRTPGPHVRTGELSGGNLQRLLVGREIQANPKVLVVAQPTRGLDVGATEAVHSLLLKLRERGTAILLISEDLDEILALSDRVAVLFAGRVVGLLPRGKVTRAGIGALMGGHTGEGVV